MAFQAQAGAVPQQVGGEGDTAAQSQQLQALIAQLQHQQASSQQMQARAPRAASPLPSEAGASMDMRCSALLP